MSRVHTINLSACDEFSTYIHSFAMKTKSNIDIIAVFISLVSFFKQFGQDVKFIHSDHERALISATSYLNSREIQHNTIDPDQHEQKSKDMFRLSIRDFDQF